MKMFITALLLVTLLPSLTACGRYHGKDGTAGARGLAGASGTDGQDGAEGQPGVAGPTGEAGADGTLISIVRLCYGTTAYPSTFVEIAFCVDGTLYATYSANGGFQTEIPPGSYSSNGINASCSFIVGPNCAVSH